MRTWIKRDQKTQVNFDNHHETRTTSTIFCLGVVVRKHQDLGYNREKTVENMRKIKQKEKKKKTTVEQNTELRKRGQNLKIYGRGGRQRLHACRSAVDVPSS